MSHFYKVHMIYTDPATKAQKVKPMPGRYKTEAGAQRATMRHDDEHDASPWADEHRPLCFSVVRVEG